MARYSFASPSVTDGGIAMVVWDIVNSHALVSVPRIPSGHGQPKTHERATDSPVGRTTESWSLLILLSCILHGKTHLVPSGASVPSGLSRRSWGWRSPGGGRSACTGAGGSRRGRPCRTTSGRSDR